MQDNDIPAFDRQLGRKIREARLMRGVTQTKLGQAVGVSYQQIQKLESGKNRIPAGRLYEIANFLNMPLGYFLITEGEPAVQRPLLNEPVRLARNIDKLPSEAIRRHVKGLVRAINEAWEVKPGQ